jgi:hypothetical protein
MGGRPQSGAFTDQSGSSVEAPSQLTPFKSDRAMLSLRSRDGKTIATLETMTEERPGFPGHDPDGDLSPHPNDCDRLPPVYRVVKRTLSAFSCVKRT